MQARARTHKFIYFIRLSIKRLKNGQDEKPCYQTYIKSFSQVTKAVAAGAISGHALPLPPSPLARLFPAEKTGDKQPTGTSVATIATEIAHKGKGCVPPHVHAACKADVRSGHGARSGPTPHTSAAHCAERPHKQLTIRKMTTQESEILPQAKRKHLPFPPQLRAERSISILQRYKIHVFFVHLPCVTF